MRMSMSGLVVIAAVAGACAGSPMKGGSYEEVYERSYSKGYDDGFHAGLEAASGGVIGGGAYSQGNEMVQAIQAGKPEDVKRLIEEDQSKATEADGMGYSPLHYAARNGRIEIISMLIDAGADVDVISSDGFTPLKEAVISSRPKAAKRLLDAGARIDATDNLGVGLVQNAVEGGNIKMLEILVEAGADVNTPTNIGQPPLISAVLFGLVPMVSYLAEHGAKLDAKDNASGRTALAWAVVYGNLPMVKQLLDAGASAATTDIYGNTPLLEAAAANRSDIVRALLQAGADPDAVSTSATPVNVGGYPYLGAPMPTLGGIVSVYTSDGNILGNGRRSAHLAALFGNMGILKMLKDRDADMRAEDYGGSTPADLAAKAGHAEVVRFLEKVAPSKKKTGAGARGNKKAAGPLSGIRIRHAD